VRGVWRALFGTLCPSLGAVVMGVVGKDVAGGRALRRDPATGRVRPVPAGVSVRVGLE